MALIDKKILNPIRYHQDNANTVIGQASAMKALFDQGAEDLRVKLNGVIDELLATTGAQQIGIDPARGLGNTLADALTNIKDYMNLGATGISATTIGTGSGNTVQSQLEWLLLQIQNVLLNQIPDGTITMQKLATALADTINANTSNIGDLATLTTTEKTNLVGAVNELVSQSAQIEAEINTPDSASLSLTGLQQIKSVTDSYASPAKLTLGGATLYNAVTNGDFANGTTGWISVSSTQSVSNKVLSLVCNGTAPFPYSLRNTGIPIPPVGTKIFYRARARVTNANSTFLRVALSQQNTLELTNGFVALSNPLQNQWYDLFGVATVPSGLTGNLYVYVQHRYMDAATANGKVMEVDGNVGVFAIPMTGTPYENYTADQMNALVNTYFEGLKSTNKMEILTRGRNLFDKSTRTIGKTLDATGAEIVGATDFTSNFIRVKPSTTYFLSGKTTAKFYAQYDRNKNFISAASNTNGQIVTTANTAFLKISALESNVDAVILGQSTTALNYEQYQGSKAKIQCTDETKFTLAKLPNNVKNEILINDGKWRAIKRVERYVLQSADILSLVTALSNVDYLTANLRPDEKLGTSGVDGMSYVTGFGKEVGFSNTNLATSINSFFKETNYRLIISKGTYASLAAAQTALAGTVIYYELATPITIEEKDFAFYSISINGSISSNLGYTEFVVNDYNILASTDIRYSQNLAESISEVAKNIDGIRDNYAQINQVAQLAQIQPHLSKQVTDADGAHGFKIENGTFTPRVAGGAGGEALYSFQYGTYQLMGNRVFYDLEVVISSKNNIVGDVLISGLPFVLLSPPTQTREVSTYSGIILPSGKYQIGALGLAGTPLLFLLASGNQYKKVLNVDEITNSFEIRISGSYLI